ncbi:hypothetical protein VPH184E373B_0113 [Vibrio phage 184E37-3b]
MFRFDVAILPEYRLVSIVFVKINLENNSNNTPKILLTYK